MMSPRNGKIVCGPSGTWRPLSAGKALISVAKATSYGIPLFSNTTKTFVKVPTEIRAAPGKRQLRADTRAMQMSPMRYTANGDVGTTYPSNRRPAPMTRRGQRWRVKEFRRRQSPPNAMPAAIPATTPLTSMGVAHERLACEPASELRQRLVVDRWQVVGLE